MEDKKEVVKEEEVTTPPVSEDVKPQEQETEVTEETTETPVTQAGDKTDPNLLLKSLQDEREKRRIDSDKITLLEGKIEELESSALSDEVFSDEGKVLDEKIKVLKTEVSDLKSDSTKKDLFIAHPVLKDKWTEFEEFRSNSDNKGMNMKTAAKAFLTENGLLDPPRKGLEKTTGGDRTPVTSGMTADEVKNLRENHPEEYRDKLMKGLINIKS